MSKAFIKICGVKDIKIAKHAINCGASFLGFVFFENSSRNISISKCKEILDEINGKVNTVAVTVNPTHSDLKAYSEMKFTHVQLHGNESLNEVRKINETYNLKIIKSFSISTESDLDKIKEYCPFISIVVFAPLDTLSWVVQLGRFGFVTGKDLFDVSFVSIR